MPTPTWRQQESTPSIITSNSVRVKGRDPSGAFDTKAYLADNPDVAAAVITPLTHHLQFGAYELRDSHADGVLTGATTIIA